MPIAHTKLKTISAWLLDTPDGHIRVDRELANVRIESNLGNGGVRTVLCPFLNRFQPKGEYALVKEASFTNTTTMKLKKLSVAEEHRSPRDWTQQKAISLLRDWKRLLHAGPVERKAYTGSLPRRYFTEPSLYSELLSSLNETAFRELTTQGRTQVIAPEFLPGIESYKKKLRLREVVPTLHFSVNDQDGEAPWKTHQFALQVIGIDQDPDSPNLNYIRSVLDTVNRYDRPEFELNPQDKQIIDLSKLLSTLVHSPREKNSIGTVLSLLAEAAGIKFMAEIYYKLDQLGTPIRLDSLRTTRGTLHQLLNAICQHWQYEGKLDAGVYYFWPKTWVHDRLADVPEATITTWERRIQRDGGVFIATHLGMAQTLSWPQYRVTLPCVLPRFSPLRHRAFQSLKIVAYASPPELAALTQAPVPFARLSPNVRDAILAEIETWRPQYADITRERLSRSIVSLSPSTGRLDNGRRYPYAYLPTSLKVQETDGTVLWPAPSAFPG